MKKRGLIALAVYLLTFLLVTISILAARTVLIDTIISLYPSMETEIDSINILLIAICVFSFIPLFFKLLQVLTGAKAFGFVCMLIDCYLIYTGVSHVLSSLNHVEGVSGLIFQIAIFVVAFISNAVSVFRRSE